MLSKKMRKKLKSNKNYIKRNLKIREIIEANTTKVLLKIEEAENIAD